MNLLQHLQEALPKDQTFKVVHVQSEPKECNPLIRFNFSHSSFKKPKLTVKFKHFLLLIRNDLIIFGIEVYNYFAVSSSGNIDDPNVQHLFVSKVDSTGLTDIKINVSQVFKVFLKYLINIKYTQLKYRTKNQETTTLRNINKLPKVHQRYSTVSLSGHFKVKLSLFTKSSNQYFFPNSDKNPEKHIIDGDKLLKWWMKLVSEATSDLNAEFVVADPGTPVFVNKLLIPGSINPNTYLLPGWQIGSVYGTSERCVYNVPNYADDPKTRFLEVLVKENRTGLRLSEFYHELGFRQEFRLGDVVGIIGCESQVVRFKNEAEAGEQSGIVLTNKQYKKLITMIKSEDYHLRDDIEVLVNSSIPCLLNRFVTFEYSNTVGKFEYTKVANSTNLKVNNLTGLVKRKKVKK